MFENEFFCVKKFFWEILSLKIAVKIKLSIITKTYAAGPEKFQRCRFCSRLDSRVHSDSVGVNFEICSWDVISSGGFVTIVIVTTQARSKRGIFVATSISK